MRPQGEPSNGPRVVVVGAGAFGGWTALELLHRGARVTLLDAWGPGNARASSGGETRVIRATYGSRAIYTRMAARALKLWEAYDAEWQCGLLRKTGVLWMLGAGTDASGGANYTDEPEIFGRTSVAALRETGLPIEELTIADAAKRYPQISFDDVTRALWEPEAGYLFARRACEHVVGRFAAEGGDFRQAAVPAPLAIDGPLGHLTTMTGERIEADAFIFACGPWLPQLFPEVIGATITPTRQEVYYFGTPAGDARFGDPSLPVWADYGAKFFYGIPGHANRGFKIADDTPGAPLDPTSASREPTPAGIAAARTFLRRRFPALADAPFLGSEVCQYEASPDAHFIVDRHPSAGNVLIAGGGSGHGFKMGPVLGEMLASIVLGETEPDPQFSLARLTRDRTRSVEGHEAAKSSYPGDPSRGRPT